MLHRIRYRGPDDLHVEVGDDYTLGAVRLSIIDLEGGRQPLRNEGGDVVACQNGEIYDFVELRAELEGLGHVFTSRTDTEVLAHGWESWGRGLAGRLVGMFSVAVWDERTGEGYLARDRVGKKPLYYHLAPDGTLAFASEIKALLDLPTVSRALDPLAIDAFLGLKHVPAPRTAWRDIRAVPPGHWLSWRAGGQVRVEPYFRLSWRADPALSTDPEALDDALLTRLTRAIDRRLRSDVPVAFFLSGGIDSSLIAAIAATRTDGPIHTYTLTYDGSDATPGKELDRRCARLVSARYGTVHVEESIGPGDLRTELPGILSQFDDPFSGVLSTWYLARRIAQDVKVAVSGDGADELFGSYLTHRLGAALAHGLEVEEEVARRFGLRRDLWEAARGLPVSSWRARLGGIDWERRRGLYSRDFLNRLGELDLVEESWRELSAVSDATDPLARVLDIEWRSQLPDQILTFVDRLSMAHSLEVRCPFLDQDFVELVARLPAADRIGRDGTTKVALRRLARRFLPAEAIDRPKEGFLMPISPWLGRLGPWLREVLAPERVAATGILEPGPAQALVERFLSGEVSEGPAVFSLLALQIWHDLHGLVLA